MSQAILKAALLQTISGVQKNPASASAVFHVDTKLQNGVRCGANVRNFPTMIIDEAPALGGDDAGPNPAELLLVALGTCQEIMYAAFAAVEGVGNYRTPIDYHNGITATRLPGYPGNRHTYKSVRWMSRILSLTGACRPAWAQHRGRSARDTGAWQRVRMGDAIAALGSKIGLTNGDFEAINHFVTMMPRA